MKPSNVLNAENLKRCGERLKEECTECKRIHSNCVCRTKNIKPDENRAKKTLLTIEDGF